MPEHFVEALEAADHEQVQVLRDPGIGFVAILAIHSSRLGAAFGGVRRLAYRELADALRDVLELSRTMTLKCALAGLSGGGGKCVILDHPGLDRKAAYRLLGRYVENMRGRFFAGPDVGTGPAELASMAETTSYVTLPGPEGPGDLAAATARGVLAGLRAVVGFLRQGSGPASDLEGATFTVQGLGGVGFGVARGIREQGGRVFATDEKSALLRRAADELNIEPVDPGGVFDVGCDVLVPCAIGGILHDLTIERIRCRAVAGSANNVLAAPEHAATLHARGILFAPDYLINSGALILGANFHLTGNRDQGAAIDRIGDELFVLLRRAAAEDCPPSEVADRIAERRLRASRRRDPFFPPRNPA